MLAYCPRATKPQRWQQRHMRARLALVAAGAALLMGLGLATSFEAEAKPRKQQAKGISLPASVPAPKPRPRPGTATAPDAPERSAAKTAEAPPPPACLKTLAGAALVVARAPINGPDGCGGPDVVKLEAVFTRSGRRIALEPAADLRCGMAETVVQWVREDVVPAMRIGDAPLAGIKVAASYHCRPRNNIAGAQLSEHGLANALDVTALRLADGKLLDLTDRTVPKTFRARMKETACARFATVLGPGSDGYHEDHIHLDMRARRSAFKLCRWEIFESAPAPVVAAAKPKPLPVTKPLPVNPITAPSKTASAAKPSETKPSEAKLPETKPLPTVLRGRQAVAGLAAPVQPAAAVVLAVSAPMPPPRPAAVATPTAAKHSTPRAKRRSSKSRRGQPDPFRDFKKLFQL